MKFINRFKRQKGRQIHFFGDSHMLGYEVDHDRVLGRNTYKEKKQWIEYQAMCHLEKCLCFQKMIKEQLQFLQKKIVKLVFLINKNFGIFVKKTLRLALQ